MATAPNLTDEQRAHVLRLLATGMTRGQVAKATGVSATSVGRIAKANGHDFDRTRTANATQAKQVDNRARRADLVARLYGRADAVLTRLEEERYTYTVVVAGKGTEVVQDEHPPSADERNLGGAIGGYLAAAARLEAIDAEGTASPVKAMLTALGDALGVPPVNPS